MSVLPTSSDDVKLMNFGCFDQLLLLKLGCYLEKTKNCILIQHPETFLCGTLKRLGWQNFNFSDTEKFDNIFKDF